MWRVKKTVENESHHVKSEEDPVESEDKLCGE